MENLGEKPTAKIAGLVLAAGVSRRAGPVNKLLVDIDGRAMVAVTTASTLAAGLDPVVVVTGFEAPAIEAAVADLNVRCIHNPEYQEGMAAAIRHGVAALDEDVAAVMICLGDMPWVKPETLKALTDAFNSAQGREICRPVMSDKPGNPVLFARRFFPALVTLQGDRGAKAVIQEHSQVVADVAVDDPGIFKDLDVPAN
jgi:molybdenum cofactor cytidylyltransferase